jgi:methylated-DNA-[protein]-cysteine S-methyltransferase
VGFVDQPKGAQLDPAWEYNADLRCDAIDQLHAYFAGTLREFDLPLVLRGTDFQKRVWRQLAQIRFGETTTYGAIAAQLGKPTASRAVGAANGQNPISIVLPCHRVIGKSGKLTGYAGGLDKKEKLLRFERDCLG